MRNGKEKEKEGVELLSGERIGYLKQTWILLLKRGTVFKSNWFPYVIAFLLPVVAAALTQLYVRNQPAAGCTPTDQNSATSTDDFTDLYDDLFLVAGPTSRLNPAALQRLYLPALGGLSSVGNLSSLVSRDDDSDDEDGDGSKDPATAFLDALHYVDSLDDFHRFVQQNRKNVTPAGWYYGDENSPPTVAYQADIIDVVTSVFGQNALNIILANTSIATNYAPFDIPWAPSTGDSCKFTLFKHQGSVVVGTYRIRDNAIFACFAREEVIANAWPASKPICLLRPRHVRHACVLRPLPKHGTTTECARTAVLQRCAFAPPVDLTHLIRLCDHNRQHGLDNDYLRRRV